jgi:hypothetical protein
MARILVSGLSVYYSGVADRYESVIAPTHENISIRKENRKRCNLGHARFDENGLLQSWMDKTTNSR